MKVIDDGVIKYDRSNFSHSSPLQEAEYLELEYWRKKLYQLNLIGEEAGIGFGNLSVKKDYSALFQTLQAQFLITGTQTGKYSELNGSHYTRVLNTIFEELKIWVHGPLEASSEALTHAAVYESHPEIFCVFHIHSPSIWQGMIRENMDSTPSNVPYGTFEMTQSTRHCIKNKSGAFCMRGHIDGVVIYADSLQKAWEITSCLHNRFSDEA